MRAVSPDSGDRGFSGTPDGLLTLPCCWRVVTCLGVPVAGREPGQDRGWWEGLVSSPADCQAQGGLLWVCWWVVLLYCWLEVCQGAGPRGPLSTVSPAQREDCRTEPARGGVSMAERGQKLPPSVCVGPQREAQLPPASLAGAPRLLSGCPSPVARALLNRM